MARLSVVPTPAASSPPPVDASVATTTASAPAAGRLRVVARRGLAAADPVLFSYSQVLFGKSRVVGLLLALATFGRPHLGAFGLGAVLLSMVVVRLARFSGDAAAAGLYGYNPLLVGLGLGAFLVPSPAAVVVTVVAVVAVVYLQTALESALGYFFNLPVVSLPFLVVTLLTLAAAPLLPVTTMTPYGLAVADPAIPAVVVRYLEVLGAIVFQPGLGVGLVVLAALLAYSRVGVLLSVIGFAVAHGVASFAVLSSPAAPVVLGVNGVLLALALGGVWFVARPSSMVFAAVAVVLASVLGLASFMLLLPLALPTLIGPFNVGLLGALYAMRQRTRDGEPKAVDFAAGTPEQNLAYYRTRVARFGTAVAVRIGLPFSGRWTVTQGIDGAHTHREAWRHALDFEVLGPDGRAHRGLGAALEDYHCYRLPVLAPADGTVVKVRDGVPDNRPGQRHPGDNWGNVVVLQHGVGLYSLVAHLAPGTLTVSEGRVVRAGTRLGLCGNSGRSFVPHLHLQLQGSPRVGAPTLALELHDVVVEGEHGPRLHGVYVPREGERVRALERAEDLAAPFALPIGARWRFRVSGEVDEVVTSRIGLYGDLYLEGDRGDRLYFENVGKQFLVYDYLGRRTSVLYLLYAAATRVPYEDAAGLAWSDVLARRRFRSGAVSWAIDFAEPFLPLAGDRLEYRLERRAGDVVVRGEGRLAGRPAATTARLEPDRGPVELTLALAGKTRIATLVEVHHAGG